jgi:sugar phosphate isomerase/epimerase
MAATGAAVLAMAGAAGAQDRPASVGEGVPTGQGGVQLFNYGSWFRNGGGTGDANPVTNVAPAADGSSCMTAQSDECRWNRTEALFAFLESKGTTNVELFGHAGFPASDDIAGLERYRALLDKYHLHAGGWHGDMSESGWDERVNAARILGADYIGSGGFPSPGINTYDDTLRTVEALNRLGKRAIEGGVGQVYFHNHTGEFDHKYVDNGELKTAWQIVVERMDPRYAAAEIDAFWSSDAFNDVTGEETAALINAFPDRVKLLHMKDGVNVAGQPSPTNSRSGDPEPWGTGEVDFRPIIEAAKDRVQYYHQEEDGGTLTGADISLSNMKGVGSQVKPAVLGHTTTFPSVAAGTPANVNIVPVTITNKGDAPLEITGVNLANGGRNAPPARDPREGERPDDFDIISDTCDDATVAKFGTCVVNVGFAPTVTNTTSVTRLVITSNADDATESIYLVGKSTGDAFGTVGGQVPTALSLDLGSASASFGTFLPATEETYDTALAASVVTTAGDAALTVADASPFAAGHLVNGTFALTQPLQVNATNAASPDGAFAPLGAAPATLVTYSGPTAGAETVTIGLRQAIGANEVLRAGSYSKTLTFSLSTTTP